MTVVKRSYDFLYRTVNHLIEDEGYRIAAEASFYLIFSIFPLLFIVFASLGQLSTPVSENSLLIDLGSTVSTYVPEFTLETLVENLERMIEKYQGTDILLATILFLWPASNVFYAYTDAAGKAYGVKDERSYLQSRLLSVALLVGAGTIIFLTSLLVGLMPLLVRGLELFPPLAQLVPLLNLIRFLGAFFLVTPCIGLIYYYGPDLESRERHVIWPGAIFATVLWVMFSLLFGLYIKYLDTYRALYGTLGSAMLLLLWMYLASLAIVLGAEFNYTWQVTSPEQSSESA